MLVEIIINKIATLNLREYFEVAWDKSKINQIAHLRFEKYEALNICFY